MLIIMKVFNLFIIFKYILITCINKKYSQCPMICCNTLLQKDTIFVKKIHAKCFILA